MVWWLLFGGERCGMCLWRERDCCSTPFDEDLEKLLHVESLRQQEKLMNNTQSEKRATTTPQLEPAAKERRLDDCKLNPDLVGKDMKTH